MARRSTRVGDGPLLLDGGYAAHRSAPSGATVPARSKGRGDPGSKDSTAWGVPGRGRSGGGGRDFAACRDTRDIRDSRTPVTSEDMPRLRASTGSSPFPTSSPSSAWPASRSSSGSCSARPTRRRPPCCWARWRHRLDRRVRGPPFPSGVDRRQGARPGGRPAPRGHRGDRHHRPRGRARLVRCGHAGPRGGGVGRRPVAGLARAPRIDVLWVGKAGTFALMFAYPAFLSATATPGGRCPSGLSPGSPASRPGPGLDRRRLLRPRRPHGAAPRAAGPEPRGSSDEGRDHGRGEGTRLRPADLQPAQADAAHGQHAR